MYDDYKNDMLFESTSPREKTKKKPIAQTTSPKKNVPALRTKSSSVAQVRVSNPPSTN